MSLATLATVASMTPGIGSVASVAMSLGKSIVIEAIQLSSLGIRKILSENPKLLEHLEELDMSASIHVIDAIVVSLPDDKILNLPENKPLRIAVNNLQSGIEQVHKLIEQLDEGIRLHENLWFSRWRRPIYLDLIIRLENTWKLVKKREETLISTTQYLANNQRIKQNAL